MGEQGYIFRELAAGNVLTLGFLCLLMLWDMRRYQALIPMFVVLKGFSALAYLYVYLLKLRYPLFLAVFFWDSLAVFLVVFFGLRAQRALSENPLTLPARGGFQAARPATWVWPVRRNCSPACSPRA